MTGKYDYSGIVSIEAVAVDDENEETSDKISFELQGSTPVLVQGSAYDIKLNSVIFEASVISHGGSFVLDKGVCWALHNAPSLNDNSLSAGPETGEYQLSVTG